MRTSAKSTLITRPATGPALTRVRSIVISKPGGARRAKLVQTATNREVPARHRGRRARSLPPAPGRPRARRIPYQKQYLARRPGSCYPMYVGPSENLLSMLPPRRGAWLMGVLNVTPDSFHDGGRHFVADDARARVDALLDEGADLIDIGGESTRPGCTPVPAEEQLRRIGPALSHAVARGAIVSVDTASAEVAASAIGARRAADQRRLVPRGRGPRAGDCARWRRADPDAQP